MSTGYIGFGNSTLESLPKVHAGDTVECLRCGEDHTLRGADNGDETLLFYECSGKLYLGAVHGRLVAHVRPDVSGKL